MRTLLSFTVLLFSSVGFASYPAINDYTKSLNSSGYGNGEVRTMTVEQTILSKTSDGWKFRNVWRNPNGTVGDSYTMESENFLTTRQVREILKNCGVKKGKRVLVTVPAGTFNSCLHQQTDPVGDIQIQRSWWYADVVGGFAKTGIVQSNGAFVTNELVEQRPGK